MNIQHIKTADGWDTKFTIKMDLNDGLSTDQMYEIADHIKTLIDIEQEELTVLSRTDGIKLKPRRDKVLVTMRGKFRARTAPIMVAMEETIEPK